MIKEDRPMNFGLQIATFKKLLKNRGIDCDTLDLKCMLDSSLEYGENLAILTRYLGVSALRGDKEEKERTEDFARQVDEWFVQAYGEQANEQLKKAEKTATYAKIELLGETIFKQYEQYEIKPKSSIRITNVYELQTVKLMLKKMTNATFKESGFRDYCIFDFGKYKFFQDLEKYNTIKLIGLNNCVNINFSNDSRKFKQNLNFQDSILKGESGYDLHLFCTKDQKKVVKQIIDFFSSNVFKETTIANIYLIYGLNSYFRCNKQIQKYENAHYYYSDDGIISNIRKQLIDFRETVVSHFINILPILREELRIKQLNVIAGANIQLKIDTIKKIESIINETKNQFAGIIDEEDTEHVITITNS